MGAVRPSVSLVTVVLGLSVLASAATLAQRRRVEPPIVPPMSLAPLPGGNACDPPFAGDHCPPPPGPPECRVAEHAQSRDGAVSVELVEDGHRLGLQAVHFVIRDGAQTFARRSFAERGVGCGTFEMFSTDYRVESLRVEDVLHGPRPEIVMIGRHSRGEELVLCTTDVTPPVCVRGDLTARPRFRRPDLVIAGRERYRMGLVSRGPL